MVSFFVVPAIVLSTQREEIDIVGREHQVLHFYFMQNESSVDLLRGKIPDYNVSLRINHKHL